MGHVTKTLLWLKKHWYDCGIEGHLYISFNQTVKRCYKQPLPPAAPEPGSSSCAVAGAQPGLLCNLEVSTPDWWTRLLLSHLQVQPVARLNMYPRDTHRERTSAWLATQTAVGKALPSTAPTCNASRSDITANSPSSCLAGKDWCSLVCVLVDPPSTGADPLSAQHPCPDPRPPYPPHGSSLPLTD